MITRQYDMMKVMFATPCLGILISDIFSCCLGAVNRIRAAGGDVVAGDVVVGGDEFSLTRAIGNSFVKVRPGCDYKDINVKQVVTSEPEVSITPLIEEDAFLVLASDGLWDRMTNQEVVDFITNSLAQHGDPQLASQELAQHAMINLRSSDNVSIVIVIPRMAQHKKTARLNGM